MIARVRVALVAASLACAASAGAEIFRWTDASGEEHFSMHLADVPESQRARLVRYLEHWQEKRGRASLLPSRRGKHLQIEWTGYALHIDDKLRPKKKADADEVAGLVDVRVNDTAVEFLTPR